MPPPDGDHEPALPPLGWNAGTSDVATELALRRDGSVSVGLFAACLNDRTSGSVARVMVEERWRASLAGDGDALTVLERSAAAADRALRDHFEPSDPEGRGAVVLARAHAEGVIVLGTSSASAYRVRNSAVVETWTPTSDSVGFPSMDVHFHVGGRPRDAGPLEAAHLRDPWPVGEPGDRIVLATRDVRVVLRARELGALAGGGSPEAAAQTIAEACRLRGGLEVAVAVLQLGAVQHEEEATDPRWMDLLSSLDGLEQQLVQHSMPPSPTLLPDDVAPEPAAAAPAAPAPEPEPPVAAPERPPADPLPVARPRAVTPVPAPNRAPEPARPMLVPLTLLVVIVVLAVGMAAFLT